MTKKLFFASRLPNNTHIYDLVTKMFQIVVDGGFKEGYHDSLDGRRRGVNQNYGVGRRDCTRNEDYQLFW